MIAFAIDCARHIEVLDCCSVHCLEWSCSHYAVGDYCVHVESAAVTIEMSFKRSQVRSDRVGGRVVAVVEVVCKLVVRANELVT